MEINVSKLNLLSRPWAEFDTANKKHREYYAQFMKLGTWGRCPVRFVDQNDLGNLAAAMQQSMVQYYTDKEFSA